MHTFDLEWSRNVDLSTDALFWSLRVIAEHMQHDDPRWDEYLKRSDEERCAALGKSRRLIGAIEQSFIALGIGTDGKAGGWGYKHGGKK
jgi:hypothetical protein